MIQVKIVFKLDKDFEANYENLMGVLLRMNTPTELLYRKNDVDVWTEKKLDKYYQIKAFFTLKELKALDEDFHKYILVFGDDRFGEYKNIPNKLKSSN